MSDRITGIDADLRAIIQNGHVYFQPPPNISMLYPAIVYKLNDYRCDYADNLKYKLAPSYQVVLIDKNPDSSFVEKILGLDFCSFDRHYVADNLNHWVFTIY